VLSEPLLYVPLVLAYDVTVLVGKLAEGVTAFGSDGLKNPPNAPPTKTDLDIDPIREVSGIIDIPVVLLICLPII